MSNRRDEAVDIALALMAVGMECELSREAHGRFHSAHEGYAILKEEVDELWEAVRQDDLEHAAFEAVQVAAMAVRFICDLIPDITGDFLDTPEEIRQGKVVLPQSAWALYRMAADALNASRS